MNFKQIKAIEQVNKNRILAVNPKVTENSGVYIFTRFENGFKYAYIGQAKNLLQRLASHLNGYNQHIDKSLKAHKLYSEKNPTGWDINFIECENLDEMEQRYIDKYANELGFQLHNKTSGGQGKGKKNIADIERKGYNQGLRNGYEKARKEVAKLFEKNLTFAVNGETNKLKERALEKFKEFLEA